MQKLLSLARKCVEEYDMIKPNDRVAVGVSGGKDSLALLWALASLRRFYPVPFALEAITIDMGNGIDLAPIAAFCDTLDVPFSVVKTQIKEIVFDIRKEENPCSLCAKLRRGQPQQRGARHRVQDGRARPPPRRRSRDLPDVAVLRGADRLLPPGYIPRP